MLEESEITEGNEEKHHTHANGENIQHTIAFHKTSGSKLENSAKKKRDFIFGVCVRVALFVVSLSYFHRPRNFGSPGPQFTSGPPRTHRPLRCRGGPNPKIYDP